MDRKITSSKEKGYVEKVSLEPTKAAQAAISQAAAWAAKGGKKS